jgi:Sulfotransferase domain
VLFLNYVLGRYKLSSRSFAINPDDVFIVSYFKSGNTWVRFLLANLLNPDRANTFDSVERMSPDIYEFRYDDFCTLPRPRLIKSHEGFDPRYPRVIYIVRDPRDVAISLYHFLRKRRSIDDSVPLSMYAGNLFIRGTGSGITWREHVGSWMSNAKSFPTVSSLGRNRTSDHKLRLSDLGASGHGREFLLVRYEDLFADPSAELSRIAEFLNVAATHAQIKTAVERSSADRMRRMEEREKTTWILTRGTRQDINFIREARPEQWRTTLTAESIATIEIAWGDMMQLLNYRLSTDSGDFDLLSGRTLEARGE